MTDDVSPPNVVSRRDFLPFGEHIPANATFGRDGLSSAGYNASAAFSQQFTGQERDEESDLDYFIARYYGSTVGRFGSVDPQNAGAVPSDPQSWNGYAYVRGNPLVLIDPTGKTIVLAGSDEEREQLESMLREIAGSGEQFISVKTTTDTDGNTTGVVQINDAQFDRAGDGDFGLIFALAVNPGTVTVNIAGSGHEIKNDLGATERVIDTFPNGQPGVTFGDPSNVELFVLTPDVYPGDLPPILTGKTQLCCGESLPTTTTEVLIHELGHAAFAMGAVFRTPDMTTNGVAVGIENGFRKRAGLPGTRRRH